MNELHHNCPHGYEEPDENYRLDMCRLHPEKIWGVTEGYCAECCNIRYDPQPTPVRPIYGSVDHYDVDAETGTVSYHVVRTNGDRLRAMTNVELADKLNEVETMGRAYGPMGKVYWWDWLEKEVGE